MKKRNLSILFSLFCVAAVPLNLSAATVYWDINGTTAGAGGAAPGGAWTGAFWNTVSDGTAATGAFVSGDGAVFSAGNDATGAFTVSGNATASSILVEEGTVTISGTVTLGAGTVTVNSGAILSTDSSARISTTAGAVYTLNGGTLRTTNPGAAGSFVDVDSTIVLNGGGTFTHTAAGVLNIIQTGVIVSGTGPLTKEGAGILAIASPSTYTGATIINDGTFRIRGSNERLPNSTAVTIATAARLDVDGLTETVSSLTGSGTVELQGTSAGGTLILSGSDSPAAFTGTIIDGGLTGKITRSGTGTTILTGNNTYTGGTTKSGTSTLQIGHDNALGTGKLTWSAGTISSDSATARTLSVAVDITGNVIVGGTGAVTFQTGAVTLTGNRTITVNNTADTTFAQGISGAARSLTKAGAGKLIVNGATYTGNTTVSAGTMVVTGSIASGTNTVAAGATLDVSGIAGGLTLGASGKLTGAGTVIGTVAFGSGSTIAPGSSPGTLTTGDQTWAGGATYAFEINDATGAAGADPGWDLDNIVGSLAIGATPLSQFNVNVTSLTLANIAGDAVNFDKTQSYSWRLATASGGITGFDAAAFNIVTSGFSNDTAGAGLGTWFMTQTGNDVLLNFAAVPEPSTVALGIMGGLAFIGTTLRRRFKK